MNRRLPSNLNSLLLRCSNASPNIPSISLIFHHQYHLPSFKYNQNSGFPNNNNIISNTQLCTIISTRSLTYLHAGKRINGLKRDPSSFLINPHNLVYTDLNDDNYYNKIKESLNLEAYNIGLTNDLLLQIFTHKSFAHGQKAYNEKFQLLGTHFLKYYTSVYTVTQVSNDQDQNQLKFNRLGSLRSKLLIDKTVLSKFIELRKLNEFIFWKLRNPLKDLSYNGSDKVYSSVITALVGGILLTKGDKKAIEFINGEFLNDNSNESTLISIVNDKNYKK
ncbi:hypothetical protein TBLA_0B10040 [Henningerozyma blattae CBS 6284]|uniref:RNase III domain-containing protein n=1 Tax=Henningerozyma blattae (strain ATCC 34711 / CBS 6284 / DSM 70876 / NBRC 10599 / NRRL Y-10934 / UCD 77-7) TaxID=1071380 RepID=I2H0B9_HENB6|nr:hypothetical protein TBLA_0B10040 [Tetrapisispora blattae CBS 6284]CCH59821.1 hypothetical protein TBLA_0B10040 [Tetrapisispora blattae CBS 6284]